MEKRQNDKMSKKKRLHTSYGQTVSGRLSSSENLALGHGNNLQNFPDKLRDFVIPEDGNIFLCPDLSQAEALEVIYESKAEKLKELVTKKGKKIHSVLGSWIYEKQEALLTTEEYDIAKRLVHGCNYRIGPLTFSRKAGVTMTQGKLLQAKYHTKAFPELLPWHDKVITEGKQTRQVDTIYGRVRWFLGRLNETVAKDMVSHKPQSVVADTLNIGLLSLFIIAPDYVRMTMQLHDEIIMELPSDNLDEFTPYIVIHM